MNCGGNFDFSGKNYVVSETRQRFVSFH
jgi:hypothetical protein